MGKVRLADIAKKVGVSTVTVHNALAGNKGVSEELREKIQSVASEMGYQILSERKQKAREAAGRSKLYSWCAYCRKLSCTIRNILLENVSGTCGSCNRKTLFCSS